ncbi:sporulation histidine kinase inhibitor Sda [Bacillus sp. 31A1R]|uniref:Sporulation histidine kinase inhibitor Sda n=1 Tax=Robertmurraya mangrovi TaxID=3098077 RepID=A0ABU5J090_9BACI|nr:sporulation histidine kinase inhibitor Sda [Bacillus sp. 31A1R]MDZ5472762.1 sporulation histidine kinase inhibitor Sda [Bacillus sp. 31A1R]
MDSLKKLTNVQLLKTLRQARKLNLSKEFRTILTIEVKRRGVLMKNGGHIRLRKNNTTKLEVFSHSCVK